MYAAGRIGEGQPTWAARLAEVASHGRLAIYTGAGLSRGDPSAIPLGAEVAKRCHERLMELLSEEALSGADPSDLTSVADAVMQLDGGLELVRRTAVGVANFTNARPNFGHQVLAMLLLEGSVVVFTTNWDDCIERSGRGEHILTVISDQDRREIQSAALLKVHGCATRPITALIATSDLTNPPSWARDAVHSKLADSHTVFVGIGDVAGYVRARIEEATAAIGGGSIFVVSPNVRTNWEGSQWAALLPDLPDDQQLEVTSDEFLDYLAGACVRLSLRKISEALADDEPLKRRYDFARSAFDALTSLEALCWLRACGVKRQPGSSVTAQQAFSQAMIALGELGGDDLALHSEGRAVAADVLYEVLVGVGVVTLASFEREATARLVQFRTSGGTREAEPIFLVAGAHGRPRMPNSAVQDVLDDSDDDDLVAGPLAVRPRLIHAEDVAA